MTSLQQILPVERKPTLYEKNNRIKIKKIKFIHSYKNFTKLIIKPFTQIIKDEYVDNFLNTCNHMFKIVGFGVFVFVLNGEIHTFQVFANTTQIKPGSKGITKKMVKKSMKKNTQRNYTTDLKKMGFSNCMLSIKSNWWNGFYTLVYYDMLKTVLKNTNITTCFFINLTDYPVLYNHKCGQHILNEETCFNNKKIGNNYIPVLSGCSSAEYYDKCLVYADAWELVSQKNYWNRGTFTNRYESGAHINTNWGSKENTLIFRGKNNSCYPSDFKKNDRLRVLSILRSLYDANKLGKINLNVGLNRVTDKTILTKKNNKLHIVTSNKKTISNRLKDWVNVEGVSMAEQSNCKYILNIDGYVNAWRLCYELQYNSCIILLQSKYYSWLHNKLKHMKNAYIIDIQRKDLENEIQTCLEELERNDNIGKQIANGSLKLYKEIMNLPYIINYMTSLLSEKEFDIIKN